MIIKSIFPTQTIYTGPNLKKKKKKRGRRDPESSKKWEKRGLLWSPLFSDFLLPCFT